MRWIREQLGELRSRRGRGEGPAADPEEAEGDQRPAADPTEDWGWITAPPREGAERPEWSRIGDLRESRRERIVREGRERSAAAGARLRTGWSAIPLGVRQRIGAIAGLGALVALVLFVIVPIAPCGFPGGDQCAPEDEAVELAPAESVAYLHANLDPETDSAGEGAALAERLPVLAAQAQTALDAVAGRPIAYDLEIAPWSGGELAVVIEESGLELSRALLFEAADEGGALEFADRLLGPAPATEEIEGTELRVGEDGLAAALLDGFLAVGPEAQLRGILELAGGEGESLASDPAFEQLTGELPERRLAEVFASGDLIQRLAREEQLGALDAFVNGTASGGAAAALTVEEDLLGVAVRSLQDPELAEDSPSIFAGLASFEPELTDRVGADSLAYLGLGDPGEGAAELISTAVEGLPELLGGLRGFERRLSEREGIELESLLLPPLGGEVALSIEPTAPVAAEDGATPGTAPPPGVPYIGLLADEVDVAAAEEALAGLQGPLAEQVDPQRSGQAPVFETTEIGGVEVQSVRLSAVVELAYGISEDLLIAATDPVAIERVLGGGSGLGGGELYEAVLGDREGESSLIAYVDIRDLLALLERLGLAEDPRYGQLSTDLRTLQAAGLGVVEEEGVLSADLRVEVGEPAEPSPLDPASALPGG